jgi:hypothetical protein
MNHPSDLTFIRVEANDSIRLAIEKLMKLPGVAVLTRDEHYEIEALRIQIWMAQLHAARNERSRAS